MRCPSVALESLEYILKVHVINQNWIFLMYYHCIWIPGVIFTVRAAYRSMNMLCYIRIGCIINFTCISYQVVLDNHILQVTLSKPGGLVLCLCYGGIELRNRETNRGYAKFSMLVFLSLN